MASSSVGVYRNTKIFHVDPISFLHSLNKPPLNPFDFQWQRAVPILKAIIICNAVLKAMDDVGFPSRRKQLLWHLKRCLKKFHHEKMEPKSLVTVTFNGPSHLKCFIGGILDHYVCETGGQWKLYQREWPLLAACCLSTGALKEWFPRNIAMSIMLNCPYLRGDRMPTVESKLLECWLTPSMMSRLRIERVASNKLTQIRAQTGDLRLYYATDLRRGYSSADDHTVSGRYHVSFIPSVTAQESTEVATAADVCRQQQSSKRKRTLYHYYKRYKQQI